MCRGYNSRKSCVVGKKSCVAGRKSRVVKIFPVATLKMITADNKKVFYILVTCTMSQSMLPLQQYTF